MSHHDMIWRGSRDIDEQVGSPEITKNASGITVVRKYHGPLAECYAKGPKPGDKMKDTGANVEVSTTRIVPVVGDELAEMRVTMSSPQADPAEDPLAQKNWNYEFDSEEIQKPIEQHPRYQGFAGGSAGADAIPDVHFELIKKLKIDPSNETAKAEMDGYPDTEPVKKLWKKILRGQEAYSIAAPYVTAETEHSTRPTPNLRYFLADPPSFAGVPTALQSSGDKKRWRRAPDSLTRQGSKFRLRRKWQYADEWDEDLYD